MTRIEIFKHMISHHEDILGSFLRIYKKSLTTMPENATELEFPADFTVGREIYVVRVVIKSTGPVLNKLSKLRVYFNITSISGHQFVHCFSKVIGLDFVQIEDHVLAEMAALSKPEKGGEHEESL